jgi:hypothetical protein
MTKRLVARLPNARFGARSDSPARDSETVALVRRETEISSRA